MHFWTMISIPPPRRRTRDSRYEVVEHVSFLEYLGHVDLSGLPKRLAIRLFRARGGG